MIRKMIFAALLTVLLCSCQAFNNRPLAPGDIAGAPYPFKSMLAICSDIDGTTMREFAVYHKYLNTNADTYLGKGLALDIADSLWMFAENDDGAIIDFTGVKNESAMSYYKEGSDEVKYGEHIVHFFKSGWIDSIHSYGDFSRVSVENPVFTKRHAEMANREMLDKGLLPSVWINHGNAANVQNIKGQVKSDILSYQQGGNPDSQYYHADFTIPSGIKFIWFSDPSSKFAVASPLYPVTLEDGQQVWGFHRYTGDDSITGHKYLWSIYNLNEQLSEKNLNELVKNRMVAIVSQHMGTSNGDYIFPGATKEAFERLKEYESSGDILVARTSRLLEFVRVRDNLNYTYEEDVNGSEKINIISIDDPVLGTTKADSAEEFKGISFYVKNASAAEIFINGAKIDGSELIRSSENEKEQIIAFKWYEKNVTDYTEVR